MIGPRVREREERLGQPGPGTLRESFWIAAREASGQPTPQLGGHQGLVVDQLSGRCDQGRPVEAIQVPAERCERRPLARGLSTGAAPGRRTR